MSHYTRRRSSRVDQTTVRPTPKRKICAESSQIGSLVHRSFVVMSAELRWHSVRFVCPRPLGLGTPAAWGPEARRPWGLRPRGSEPRQPRWLGAPTALGFDPDSIIFRFPNGGPSRAPRARHANTSTQCNLALCAKNIYRYDINTLSRHHKSFENCCFV